MEKINEPVKKSELHSRTLCVERSTFFSRFSEKSTIFAKITVHNERRFKKMLIFASKPKMKRTIW